MEEISKKCESALNQGFDDTSTIRGQKEKEKEKEKEVVIDTATTGE